MQQAAADAAKKLENATEEAEETATRVSEGGGSTGSARSTGGLSGSTAAGDLVGPRHAAGGLFFGFVVFLSLTTVVKCISDGLSD